MDGSVHYVYANMQDIDAIVKDALAAFANIGDNFQPILHRNRHRLARELIDRRNDLFPVQTTGTDSDSNPL